MIVASASALGRSGALAGINRGWLLALGLLMIALGVIGLGMTYALTAIAVFWIGMLALIAGIGQILDAFHHKKWRGVIWHAIVGAVYIAVGVALTTMPTSAAYWLTLAVAVALIITGTLRLLTIFQLRGHTGLQLLVLALGLVSIGLGVILFQVMTSPNPEIMATVEGHAAWINSWKWVLGLFVAVELVTEGVALVGIAFAARRPATPDPDRRA